jgi:hypothetical protein
MRTIRACRDAWEQIGKAESFSSWKSIGAALSIGKTHALPSLAQISTGPALFPRIREMANGKWL